MQVVRRIGRGILVLGAGLLAMTVAACNPAPRDAKAATSDESVAVVEPQQVTILAKNYLFIAPDTIEAGMTTIRLRNQGSEHHHVQLVRLQDGKTVDNLMAAIQQNPNAIPSFITLVGGPNSPQPGAEALGTLDLQPGNYVLLCLIPTAEGVPHLAKGMSRPITVVPARGPSAKAPVADLSLVLDDYKFELPSVPSAGKYTIKVENRAAQPHEIFVVRLNAGVSAEQLLQGMMSPKPEFKGEALGGTTVIQNGGVNYMTLDLTPGTYAFYCFVPDAKDGKPHVAHGMMREITVN